MSPPKPAGSPASTGSWYGSFSSMKRFLKEYASLSFGIGISLFVLGAFFVYCLILSHLEGKYFTFDEFVYAGVVLFPLAGVVGIRISIVSSFMYFLFSWIFLKHKQTLKNILVTIATIILGPIIFYFTAVLLYEIIAITGSFVLRNIFS